MLPCSLVQDSMLCSEAFSLKASVIRDMDGWIIAYGVLPFYFLSLIEDAAGSEGDLTLSLPPPLSHCVEANQALCISVLSGCIRLCNIELHLTPHRQ